MANIGQITQTLRGLIFVAASVAAIVILGVPAVQSFSGYLETRDRALTIPENVITASRDKTYRTLCPDYAAASTWERWTNTYFWRIGWCEDYVDRL